MKTVRCTAFGTYANKANGREFLNVYVLREKLRKKNFTLRALHVTHFGNESLVSLHTNILRVKRQFILKIVKAGAQ